MNRSPLLVFGSLLILCLVQPAWGGPLAPVDDDHDGYDSTVDCNDHDDTIHPGATEIAGDGVDQDCNGHEVCYEDNDDDTYGSSTSIASPDLSCTHPGMAANALDCDDGNPSVHPGAMEVCDASNSVDEDCDGAVDDADPSTDDATKRDLFVDADGDGYGTGTLVRLCHGAATGGDCDDTKASVHPGATEVCDASNSIDEDCDAAVDDADSSTDAASKTTFYADADQDGHGTGPGVLRCHPTGIYTATNADDCDDTRDSIHPDAMEIVGDGIDGDCNGHELCFTDADDDGARLATTVFSADTDCDDPYEGKVGDPPDCDDTHASAHPGGTEVCDDANVDEDCDGYADDVEPADRTVLGKMLFYADFDSDGYGTGSGVLRCHPSGPYTADNANDCDDGNDSIHPGKPEIVGDEVDQDCDGHEICYVDADHDGARTNATVGSDDVECRDPGEATATAPIDCDDSNASIGAGVCSLCSSAPLTCKAAGSTRLTIRNYADDRRDQMQFTWTLGDETTPGDVGSPAVDTDYAVCVWDDVGGTPNLVMEMSAPAGGNCSGKPCWLPIGTTGGFRYKDLGLLPDGIQQLNVRAGALGKAKVSVKARGVAMPDPPMPFEQNPVITVQVVNSLGKCWGADYVNPAQINTGEKLLAKEKP